MPGDSIQKISKMKRFFNLPEGIGEMINSEETEWNFVLTDAGVSFVVL